MLFSRLRRGGRELRKLSPAGAQTSSSEQRSSSRQIGSVFSKLPRLGAERLFLPSFEGLCAFIGEPLCCLSRGEPSSKGSEQCRAQLRRAGRGRRVPAQPAKKGDAAAGANKVMRLAVLLALLPAVRAQANETFS